MTFESMVSEMVKQAVQEAMTEELKKLPPLLPAAASSSERMAEEEFRARHELRSREGFMAVMKAGTVERKALSARNHICGLRIQRGIDTETAEIPRCGGEGHEGKMEQKQHNLLILFPGWYTRFRIHGFS